MVLKSVCGFLTLQVGLTLMSIVFWVIAVAALFINIFQIFSKQFPFGLIAVIAFFVVMVASGALMFISAYNEDQKACTVALMVIGVSIVLWVILCGISFYNQPSLVRYVCVQSRCPESFWFASFNYRVSDEVKEDDTVGKIPTEEKTEETETTKEETEALTTSFPTTLANFSTDPPINTTTHKVPKIRTTTIISTTIYDPQGKRSVTEMLNILKIIQSKNNLALRKRIFQNLDDYNKGYDGDFDLKYDDSMEQVEDKMSSNKNGGYQFGPEMIGAIFLFICNLLFLLYTLLVVWSYRKELNLINRFDCRDVEY